MAKAEIGDIMACPDCDEKMVTEYYQHNHGSYDHVEQIHAEESYVWCPKCEKDQTVVVEDRVFSSMSDKY